MKKLLLTIIAALAFCGSISAQPYESHWINEFDPVNGAIPWDEPLFVVPFIQIDGEYVSLEDNYEALELGAFIDGEMRGHMFLFDDGEDYPITEIGVYHNTNETDKFITFKLYNHETGKMYVDNVTALQADKDYIELYWGMYELVPILNFTLEATGITKDIVGYTTNPEYDVETYNQANYYLISSPVGAVNAAEVTNMITGTFDFYSFIQENQLEWSDLENTEVTMEVGKGYLYANSETVTLTFPGDAYDGEGTFPLNYVETAGLKGVNLMGNPYNANATVGIEGSTYQNFYVMNADGTQLVAAERNYAEPMEGIFVIASGEGQNVTFTPDNSKNEPSLVMNVVRNRGNVIDRAIVNFGRESQLPKFQIMRPTTKVYIPMDGEDYAVVTASEMGEMPVNFKAEENGTYSMIFSNEDVNFKYLHLIDNMNGNNVDLLANPSYTFEANTTDYASRFRLVFVTDSNADSDNFTFFDGSSWIINNEGNATLQVVDVLGRIISSESINGCASVNINEAAGVYIIRLINGENVRTQKVIVK